jgi:hypothetical protein
MAYLNDWEAVLYTIKYNKSYDLVVYTIILIHLYDRDKQAQNVLDNHRNNITYYPYIDTSLLSKDRRGIKEACYI